MPINRKSNTFLTLTLGLILIASMVALTATQMQAPLYSAEAIPPSVAEEISASNEENVLFAQRVEVKPTVATTTTAEPAEFPFSEVLNEEEGMIEPTRENQPVVTSPGTGFIEVTVRDSATSSFVSSAYVRVFETGSSTFQIAGYTNAAGFYKATGLGVGWYDVNVTKAGYQPMYKQNYINWAGDDDYLYYYLDAFAPDSGFIEVTVRDSETSALLSSVLVQTYNQTTGSQVGSNIYTDTSGWANSTGLYIGWHDVKVSKTGYIPQTKANYINWNGDDDYLYFYLVPFGDGTGFVEVTVRNADTGALVSSANVQSYFANGTYVGNNVTDVNGFANMTGLYVGWYDIKVNKAGWIPQTKQNYINWNGDDDYLTYYLVPFGAGTGFIEVTAMDANDGTGLQSASVQILFLNDTSIDTNTTDVNGFTNLTSLDIGWYNIKVSKIGYVPQERQNYINWNGDDDYLYFYLVPFAANTGYIEVTVRDQSTSSPLTSAFVEILFPNGTWIGYNYTDVNGFANMTSLAIGWYDVKVSKVGYILETKANYINWNGDDDYLTYYLIPFAEGSSYIEVRVYDHAGTALVGANVWTYNSTGDLVNQGSTDGTGFYNVTGLTIGWHNVSVSKAGYIDQVKLNYINWNGDDDYLSFYLVPFGAGTGYIEVHVSDNLGIALSGAQVTILDDADNPLGTNTTDVNGFANLTGLDIGWYAVQVFKPGYVEESKMNYINWNGDDDYLSFFLVPFGVGTGYIEVRAIDFDTGLNISGAYVEVLDGTNSTIFSGYADADGFANVMDLDIGWYTVTVSSTGYNSETKSNYINWNGDDDYLYFALTPMGGESGYIEVLVSDEDGIPIQNATVKLYDYDGFLVGTTMFTDAVGWVNLTDLSVGWYQVNVSKNGYELQMKWDYINWNGDDDYLYFYLIAEAGTGYIAIHVYDESAVPLVNASITVYDDEENALFSGLTD
ncbi:MAG: carboxypeptidase regulatory-like domain-containing protein, partial [Candidatus Hodarchaeales archaeon]